MYCLCARILRKAKIRVYKVVLNSAGYELVDVIGIGIIVFTRRLLPIGLSIVMETTHIDLLPMSTNGHGYGTTEQTYKLF